MTDHRLHKLAHLLAKGIAALVVALVVSGCVVAVGPGGGEHWHGYHEWR
jgi:hypothetical protein